MSAGRPADLPLATALLATALLVAVNTPAQGTLFWRDANLTQARPLDLDLHTALLRLCAGPDAGERATGLTSAVPPGTPLLALRRHEDELTVVLGERFLQAGPAREDAVEQLTKTAFATANHLAPTLRSVQIRVLQNGVERDLAELLPAPPPPPPAPAHLRTAAGALAGRRIAISPGHGYYWHSTLGWTTQRGLIDGLIEDIHTAEICNRFLIPMLENLGATVVHCREHGEIDLEAFGDDDQGAPVYSETGAWSTSLSSGWNGGTYRFAGTAPAVSATATWTLPVARAGLYPVYALFRASGNRSTDARYTIHHAGGTAEVRVDQTVDDRTWVWLGDHWFAAGNGGGTAGGARIVLDNQSAAPGAVVIADAVRIGGGRGSVARGGATSNQARWRECSRYQAQFAGAPAAVWDPVAGGQDNDDDVTCRPRFSEWRTADAFVSLHTNAGGGAGTSSFVYNGGATAGSTALQAAIHGQLIADLRAGWSAGWPDRGQLAANFGEVRLLASMPGVLLELAFHDTPGSADVEALHHPRFRYLSARAIARGILRHFAPSAPFPPEPPAALRVAQDGARGLSVAWDPVPDATGYVVEASADGKGFAPAATVAASAWSTGPLEPGTVRSFRVRAENASGCSMPTEVLTAGTDHLGAAQVLLVQGFDRFGRTVKWPENTRDYLRLHGEALRRGAGFSLGFDAASNEAVALGRLALRAYRAVVWALGEESTADDTFDALEQLLVAQYLAQGGGLFASGAEIAWDLDARGSTADRAFLRGTLGATYVADDAGTYLLAAGVPGSIYAGLPAGSFDDGSQGTYDVDWPDVLAAADGSSVVCLRYGNGLAAGLQRQAGNGRVVLLGVPLETVTDADLRAGLLQRAVRFLLEPLPVSVPPLAPIGQVLPIAIDVPAEAAMPYLLLCSDATAPGIPLPGGGLLPLRPGYLLEASLNPANPLFAGFFGALDASGHGAATVHVPYLPPLVGFRVCFSGFTMQPGVPRERVVWNWVATTIAP